MHVWSSRVVVCEPRRPGLVGPLGFTRQPENSKREHLRVPAFKNTTKIQRKDPKREKEERKLWREEGKKARNFGPPTLRGSTLRSSTLRAPTFRDLTSSGFGPSPLVAPPFEVQFNSQKLAEVELAELEKKSWPKSKLAEVDRARSLHA